jgi:hypothetical protein
MVVAVKENALFIITAIINMIYFFVLKVHYIKLGQTVGNGLKKLKH